MAGGDRKNVDSVLIAHLSIGATRASAAKAANVSESTVFRRLQNETFRRELASVKEELIRSTVARLSASATQAASTLQRLLNADSESVQLGAARAILELSVKWREAEELDQRIAALEAAAARMDPEAQRWRA